MAPAKMKAALMARLQLGMREALREYMAAHPCRSGGQIPGRLKAWVG